MNISEMSGCNLVGLASSLAILISQDLSSEDIGVLAAFFSALGDNLAILSSTPTSNTNQISTETETNKYT